ncbi:MAG: alkA1 [Acidimicrobiaceae bacterium]|nr:alkA1 [Acidimicrobiaceae bacterium]
MHEDVTICLRAVQSKDARFDGMFFTAVRTTGIYCRPSCPAIVPRPQNMSFYPSAAAAQSAGYRACRRCRPDASPGSPEWNARADVVARAMRLIGDGIVDREGVHGLATRLGYSARQLERQLLAELGAGPLALARAQRAQTARLLVETSSMKMSDLAFAAGFASIRTFNDTVREVFGLSPSELRRRTSPNGRLQGPGTLSLRLAYRLPLSAERLFTYLETYAVPGVEEWSEGAYRRTMRLPHGPAVATLRPLAGHIGCELALSDLRDLSIAISRCRRLLDLDADPVAIDSALSADQVLAPLVAARAGTRIARTVDPSELAVRAVLGQQASRSSAASDAAKLVRDHGSAVPDSFGGLTHLFPSPERLAELDPGELGLARERGVAVVGLADALASGRLDLGPGCDWNEARARLGELPGLRAETVETIAMRALGDPDAFAAADPAVRSGALALGLPTKHPLLSGRADCWRPWRAYVAEHLRIVRATSEQAHEKESQDR